MKREIIFYKNYFKEFYVAQNERVKSYEKHKR